MKKLLVFTLLGLSCVAPALAQETTAKPGSEEWKQLFDPPYAQPTEVPVSSDLRKKLFEQLRPLLEKVAKEPFRFEGSLRAFKNWAFFSGSAVNAKGQPVGLPPMDNSDVAALWLRTSGGWRLVDYSGGHSDAFFIVWPEQYGAPKALLTQ